MIQEPISTEETWLQGIPVSPGIALGKIKIQISGSKEPVAYEISPEEVDAEFRVLLTSEKIREIVNLIPDDWVEWRDKNETPQDIRDIYYQFLIERIEHSETFVKEAKHAREAYL